jgi:hypothetical protein
VSPQPAACPFPRDLVVLRRASTAMFSHPFVIGLVRTTPRRGSVRTAAASEYVAQLATDST